MYKSTLHVANIDSLSPAMQGFHFAAIVALTMSYPSDSSGIAAHLGGGVPVLINGNARIMLAGYA
jgi:hypothetical protein